MAGAGNRRLILTCSATAAAAAAGLTVVVTVPRWRKPSQLSRLVFGRVDNSAGFPLLRAPLTYWHRCGTLVPCAHPEDPASQPKTRQ